MRCLTICQPYAHLIVTPRAELEALRPRLHNPYYEGLFVPKRVENRSWPTAYRGPVLIHAGKSLEYFSPLRPVDFPEIRFGDIVGAASLEECAEVVHNGQHLALRNERSARSVDIRRRFPWFLRHAHTEGRFCLILGGVRRFREPIPYIGRQQFFNVPDELVAKALATAEPVQFN